VSSLLGVSPASDFFMPTFRNHLSVPFSKAIQPLKMEQVDGSETSGCKNQTPGYTRKTTHNTPSLVNISTDNLVSSPSYEVAKVGKSINVNKKHKLMTIAEEAIILPVACVCVCVCVCIYMCVYVCMCVSNLVFYPGR
jgi:hypothetical protein